MPSPERERRNAGIGDECLHLLACFKFDFFCLIPHARLLCLIVVVFLQVPLQEESDRDRRRQRQQFCWGSSGQGTPPPPIPFCAEKVAERWHLAGKNAVFPDPLVRCVCVYLL